MKKYKAELYRPGDTERVKKAAVRRGVGAEPYRTEYRRDQARLLHSAAFRRLQGKTQLYPGPESDFFRNRLTHSLEVAQIAKSIAIRLNDFVPFFQSSPIAPELVELAGLLHDLGHPPFGHNGEKALDDCMKPYGGFEGNAQTLRIITRLERKEVVGPLSSSGIDENGRDNRIGLNFTYRSIASALKYDHEIDATRDASASLSKGYYHSDAKIVDAVKKAVAPSLPEGKKFKTIECSIMDLADDIAYSTYDLEDSFKAGFLNPISMLTVDESILSRVAKKVGEKIGSAFSAEDVTRTLVEIFQHIFTPGADLLNHKIKKPADIAYITARFSRAATELCQSGYLRTEFTSQLISEFIAGVAVDIDPECPPMSQAYLKPAALRKVEVLKNFTYEATIMSPRLKVAEHRGYQIVKDIFDCLSAGKGSLLLPDDFRAMYDRLQNNAEKKRVICDFVAGMTDRYAVEFYGRLSSENAQSIFKPI